MINKLYDSIAAGLKSVKDCIVYEEDLPGDFIRPSFLISICGLEAEGGLNHKRRNTVHLDVTYFPPEEAAGMAKACRRMGQDMNREFQIPGFKMRSRTMKPECNALHYLFDVIYWEYRTDEAEKMREMQQKTDLKED